MKSPALWGLVTLVMLHAGCAWAQTEEGRTTEETPVDAAKDPLNRHVQANTVDGLLVAIRIAGSTVTLESAQPARIPKSRRDGPDAGDTITVTGLANGRTVGRVQVADTSQRVVEGVGLERADDRVIHAALPTPGIVDEIEVSVSATGTRTRLDVRPAYAEMCRALPTSAPCRGREGVR